MAAAVYEHFVCALIGGASLLHALQIEKLAPEGATPLIIDNKPSQIWWTMTVILTTPYVMYSWIWYNPSKWLSFTKSLGFDPVDLFSHACISLKFVQLAAVLFWWASTQEAGLSSLPAVVMSQSSYALTAFAVATVAAQGLNIPVYSQLGNNGVYYGFKLGKTVPWCYGFPFNTGLRHPQYLGGTMFVWGMAHLLITSSSVADGLFLLPIGVTIMYMCISMVEQVGDANIVADSKKK